GTNQKRELHPERVQESLAKPSNLAPLRGVIILACFNRWPSLRYDHRLLSCKPSGLHRSTPNLNSRRTIYIKAAGSSAIGSGGQEFSQSQFGNLRLFGCSNSQLVRGIVLQTIAQDCQHLFRALSRSANNEDVTKVFFIRLVQLRQSIERLLCR